MLKGTLRQNFTSRNTASVKVHHLSSFGPIASQLQLLWLVLLKCDNKVSPPQMLFRLAHTVLLNKTHVAGPSPSSTLPGDGWLEMSSLREKTCRVLLCNVHQVGFVCVCVFTCCYLKHLYWPITIFCGCSFVFLFVCFTRTNYIALNVSPMSLNYCFRIKLVISCLIIVVPSRALPVPASKRDKSPSTGIHSELLFSVTALYYDHLSG